MAPTGKQVVGCMRALLGAHEDCGVPNPGPATAAAAGPLLQARGLL